MQSKSCRCAAAAADPAAAAAAAAAAAGFTCLLRLLDRFICIYTGLRRRAEDDSKQIKTQSTHLGCLRNDPTIRISRNMQQDRIE